MNVIRRALRRARTTANALAAASGVSYLLDRAIFSRTPRTPSDVTGDDRWHILLAPPGGGNIGDQAMVEAFLENTTGPVRIVVRRVGDIRVPKEHTHRARLEPVASLLYGGGAGHRRALRDLFRLLGSARSLTVVGADIMDGAYNVRASIRRADVATLARSVGVPARILGFSWNDSPHPGARRALSRAARAGTRLLVRDPLSARRARADGLPNVTEVADPVFSARTRSPDVTEGILGPMPRNYVVVNASGFLGRSTDQIREYEAIVRSLLDAGLTVVLLPHVVRSSADDAAACRAIALRVPDSRVVLVERLLEPAEVRGLCAGARFVLTGRMHLAIQALWSAVPAIALSSQGKVEGLMALLGTEALCVSPGPGLANRVAPLRAALLDEGERERYSAAIADRLPAVRRLADLNFAALP